MVENKNIKNQAKKNKEKELSIKKEQNKLMNKNIIILKIII